MVQHRTKEVCSVNNTRSSNSEMSLEKPNATSTKFLGEQALTIAHVAINMNLNKRQ